MCIPLGVYNVSPSCGFKDQSHYNSLGHTFCSLCSQFGLDHCSLQGGYNKLSGYTVSIEKGEEAENQTTGARKSSGSVYLELLSSLAVSQT